LSGNIIPRQIASASNFPVNFAFFIDLINNGNAYDMAIAVAPRVAPVAVATAVPAVIYAAYTPLSAT
jgi:hypothetical protein